jgi:diguanylate cyclase (GGDEF)-like protein
VLDIDDFKRLNDANGHAQGDRVLRAVARVLRRHARASDTAGRLGGDELALCARSTGAADAASLCTRLLATLEHEGIAVSIGVATAPGNGRSADALVRAADLALLAARAAGERRFNAAA